MALTLSIPVTQDLSPWITVVGVGGAGGNGAPAMPCGRCRQLLWEHGGPDCLIDGTGTPMPMAEVLPNAFDQRDLDEGVTPTP